MGPPDLWTPETYGDLFDYYSEIVEILEEQLNSSSVENRTDALEVILGALRPIARMSESLSEQFREILVEVVDEDWVSKQEVIQSVRSFLKYEEEVLNEIEEEKEAWEEFLWEISERDFAGKLKRYVGTHTVEDRDIRDEKIREIAEEGAKDTDQLHQHLEWLLSYEPNGQALRNLGAELESVDDEREFLDEIIETFIQKESGSRNVTLLAGYLSTLSDESEDIRQDAIEEVYTQISEYTDLVELIRLSGLTENDARRISGMVQDDKVGPSALAGFTYGGTSSNLPEDVLKEIVRYLLNNYSEGIQHIVPVYFHYYVFSDEEIKLPYDLTISLLSHPELTESPDAQIEIQGVSQDWMKVAEKLFEQYPKKRIPLIELAVDLLWRSSSIIGHSNGHVGFLSDVFDEEPRIVWTRFVEELEKKGYRYGVINWVGGMPITKLPTETFWEWIEEDPENNAPLAAQLIPSTLNHKEDEVCLARQLLVKYGDQEKVQYKLASNYCSESFSGPESEHYKKKKKRLEEFLEEESDENVTRWVRNRIEELEMKTERGKKREELLGISDT
ncbi:hypothetical protein SG26_19605 (plasmid) [Haloarcula sp. CBA1115]|nr:hypothetical protein SG26_19605 [Haloarcula sp. CBA1115]